METWPSFLPYPNLETNSDLLPMITRSDDQGFTTQTRDYRRAQEESTFSFDCGDAECLMFKTFVRINLANGALPFTISIPIGSGYRTIECKISDGSYSVASNDSGFLQWKVTFNVFYVDTGL